MRPASKRPSAARRAAPPPAALKAMQTAVMAHRANRLGDAIQAYRAAIRAAPDFAEANHNLGIALKAAGQPRAAEKALAQALKLRPDYASAHAALADLFERSGRNAQALRHRIAAFRAQPGDAASLSGLVANLAALRFSEADPQLVELVTALVRRDDVEGQRLVGAGLSLLALDSAIRQALDSGDATILVKHPPPPLLLALLERTVLADAAWERLLTRLRTLLLTQFRSLEDGTGPLVRALAAQMLATDYAYPISDEEKKALALLDPTGPNLTVEHVQLALFAPLPELRADLDAPHEWSAFVDRHIGRPLAEQAAAAAIPALTAVDDAVSQAVQAQYTALPYPRWLATRAIVPRPRQQVLAGLLPQGSATTALPPDPNPLRVLVAGCGTGKHAADVATRFANADVLAIDLSRPSLGYAKAQATRMEIANVRFAQADILALGQLAERFDHIEAMGVLHHLHEPLTGWRVLRGLLTDGGTMRIGVYARRGRAAIQAAQRMAKDYPHDAEGLRALRQAILALPLDHPAAAVVRELDFYTLNGVRDALAHAQEHDFTPLELQAMLGELKLEFLGFETVTPQPLQLYRNSYPDDPAMTDLARWEALERQHPELFHHMYQFWCRAA